MNGAQGSGGESPPPEPDNGKANGGLNSLPSGLIQEQ